MATDDSIGAFADLLTKLRNAVTSTIGVHASDIRFAMFYTSSGELSEAAQGSGLPQTFEAWRQYLLKDAQRFEAEGTRGFHFARKAIADLPSIASLIDNPHDKPVDRFSNRLLVELDRLAYELDMLSVIGRGSTTPDEPAKQTWLGLIACEEDIPYFRSLVRMIEDRSRQFRAIAGQTEEVRAHPDEDVQRVRAALELHGYGAKSDAILAACRPMRKQVALEIRRDLLAERSRNLGTAMPERSRNDGTSQTSP